MHKQFTVYMDNPEWVLVDHITRRYFRGLSLMDVVQQWADVMGVK